MGREAWRTHPQRRLPEPKDVVDDDKSVFRIVGAGGVHFLEVADRLKLARGTVRACSRDRVRHLGWRRGGWATLGVLWDISSPL